MGKRFVTLIMMLWLLALSAGLQGQETTAPRSARTANYDIIVNYQPDKQVLKGDMRLHWKNPSKDTIRKLMFHTYMNAFKSEQTTLMQELNNKWRRTHFSNKDDRGSIDIESMKTESGDNLTYRMQYVQPDDNNEQDKTVIEVELREPVLPGESLSLKINFTTRMPKVFMRTGYSRDFLFAGQWYPKIGVYETTNPAKQNGSWVCHQFHANTEFYADFGVYNVEIVTPKNYKVGATGHLVDENQTTSGKIRRVFKAEDVIDFAWTASKRFIKLQESWNDVTINLLVQPEHKRQADRYTESVKKALNYFSEVFGPYPYNQITIVDPPYHAMGASGMEYPTLITTGTLAAMPKKVHIPEMLTIREFGHQYLMGILASNQAEEPWLDEGINTYMEARIMDDVYGANKSIFEFYGYHAGNFEIKRHQLYNSVHHKLYPVLTKTWEIPRDAYTTLAYTKPAVWLKTLENIIGRQTMDKILKRYYQQWSFKHPKTQDFIQVANTVVQDEHQSAYGTNLDWFFNQMLRKTATCDYAVASISSRKMDSDFKMPSLDDVKNIITGDDNKRAEKKETMYFSQVELHRLEDVKMPVEVKVSFSDGFEQISRWDGKDRTQILTFQRPAKIVTAELDPNNKLLIDKDINNNSYTKEPRKLPIWKYMQQFLFFVQNLIQMFAIMA